MTLNEHEYRQYLKNHLELLFFVGKEQRLIPSETEMTAFLKLSFQKKIQCRDELYKHMALLDCYLDIHAELQPDEIQILEGFKRKIQSDFVILKCLARHAVFMDTKTDKIYGVKALSDRFDEFFPRFPLYCSTTILPFKDKIIYDGFISTNGSIILGPGISASMNEKYIQAKKDKAIITSL